MPNFVDLFLARIAHTKYLCKAKPRFEYLQAGLNYKSMCKLAFDKVTVC